MGVGRETGNEGRVDVDGFALHTTQWAFDHDIETEEGADTSSGGAADPEEVWEKGSGTFDAVLNTTAMPQAATPNLKAGKTVALLKLYVGNPTNARFWSFQCLITKFSIVSALKGLVKYTCSYETKGAITHPTA